MTGQRQTSADPQSHHNRGKTVPDTHSIGRSFGVDAVWRTRRLSLVRTQTQTSNPPARSLVTILTELRAHTVQNMRCWTKHDALWSPCGPSNFVERHIS